jgi:carbon starvation protein CstA
MLSFVISVIALFVGYALYSRVAERIFGPDDRETPAIRKGGSTDIANCQMLCKTHNRSKGNK